ncbi:mast cell protease 1A-like [Parambassis ranga]|uniref:Mast cell protease 1A-like n=1 Tax=Parambassis ranga TaxID=210632 RepID=A0A6P7HT60_9TELE|nr:mast cell protease 1A-like [Parambassis ranga]
MLIKKAVDVPIISLEQCRTFRRGLPPAVICAGGYNTTKGTCMGDSGGPLMCKGVAVGVVSFGSIPCDYPERHHFARSSGTMHPLIKFLLFHVLICLGQNAFGNEIINGHKAEKNTMQFMAYLADSKRTCGGFLISEDFVMTAAHCAGLKKVILGTHNRFDRNMIYNVQKECIHPDYINYTEGNDIMLLKLSRKAQLGENIKLIKIPTYPRFLKPNQMCTVAGWGLTKTAGHLADELQVVDVPVIDLKECQTQWENLPPKVICAGGYGTNKGTCDGDSGGPLVCAGVAVGVVSYGLETCDYPALPDVYTDISKFLPWINDILKKQTC